MVYTSDKRLHVNADRTKVVPEDSEDAAYILVGEGGELSDEEAAKYGLNKSARKSEDKAVAAPAENKAEPAPENKAAGTGSGLTINKAETK